MLRSLLVCLIAFAGACSLAGCGGDPAGYGKPGDSTPLEDATPFESGASGQKLPERK